MTWGPVALALAVIAAATLVPTSGAAVRTLQWCVPCGDYGFADLVANVALFVPFGWALSRAGARPLMCVVAVLFTTVTVESLQYAFVPGRDASLSDVVANTAGGIVGMALPPLRRWIAAVSLRALYGAIVYGVLLVAGVGAGVATQAVLRPRLLRWTGPSLETSDYVPFTGSLKAVRVDGTPVTMEQWHDVPRGDVEVAVDFVSARPDTGLAQIVIAWMPKGMGWMWLEQRGRDLLVHLTSTADRLLLRGHSVWLLAALPPAAGEPVSVRLLVGRYSYRAVVATASGTSEWKARIGVEDGWQLFAPRARGRPYIAWLLASGWVVALFGPLGYLASLRSRAALVGAAAGGGAGLALLPIALGSAGLSLSSWCCAAAGLVTGSLLAGAPLSRARVPGVGTGGATSG